VAQVRAQIAASVIERHGDRADVFLTERPGHAHELTKAAIRRRARLVLAWGGDGTINEVASALAFDDVPLGIVPSGSGNGLATELGIDPQPEKAIASALQAVPRLIDLGEIGGRLFVNVAGIGIDAHVAALFNDRGNVRRGFVTYARITGKALFAYTPRSYRIVADSESIETSAVVLTIANGTQYGNNARIAPHAKLDDGLVDLVVVKESSRLRTLLHLPRLFTGTVERMPGCTIRRVQHATIESDEPMTFHVDGESARGGTSLKVRVHPRALWIAAPSRE
jgi:YegS/Rv2252/BmrU family lipid kinase